MAKYIYKKYNATATVTYKWRQYNMDAKWVDVYSNGGISRDYEETRFQGQLAMNADSRQTTGLQVYQYDVGSGTWAYKYKALSGYIKGAYRGTVSSTSSTAYPTNGQSGSYWYDTRTSSTSYSQGSYIGQVTAEEGTYPDNGMHTDGFWYVLLPNQMPIISGVDENRGGVNSPFTYSFTVDDLDSNQTLSIKINKSWSSQVQTIGNAKRNQNYTVEVTAEEFNSLPLDAQQEIHIEVTDGAGAIANRYITFRRTNAAPTITINNKDLGNVGHEGITFDYSISDLENDIVKLEFMFGGQVFETVEDVVLNETHNFTIKKKEYVKIPNGEQVITLRATDSKGANNFDVVRFVKEVHGCGFILSQEVDTIVDYAFFNAKIDIADEEVFKLEFCNNFNDDEPIWEEGTLGKIHNFTNKSHINVPKVAVRPQVLEEPNMGESFISSPAVLKWGWN